MPGNPLSTFTVNEEQAGRPYDEQAPSGERWGAVPVTAAPKAVFDASNPAFSNLGQTVGHIRVTNGSRYGVVDAPDGEKAFNYEVGGNPSAYGDTTLEIKYEILVPTFESYHHFRWKQPDNFYHRKCVAVNGDLSQAQNWVKGDVVNSSDGFSGTFYSYEVDANDGEVITIENYGGQFSQNWSGRTITNQRTGESFVSTASHLIESNNKLFHEWVDGEYPYSNGGLKIEYDAAGNGASKIKPNKSASYRNGEYFGPSNLGNSAPGKTDDEIVFDLDDNGFDIEFVIGRKRSLSVDSNEGALYLWKRSHRPGSPYENWQLLFQREGTVVWGDNSEGVPNAPTRGYHFGAANSGYGEDTAWLIKFWHYWTQKPTFLP